MRRYWLQEDIRYFEELKNTPPTSENYRKLKFQKYFSISMAELIWRISEQEEEN